MVQLLQYERKCHKRPLVSRKIFVHCTRPPCGYISSIGEQGCCIAAALFSLKPTEAALGNDGTKLEEADGGSTVAVSETGRNDT